MSADKLQRLTHLSKRWRSTGRVRKRETLAADSRQQRSGADGSESLLSVIRLVNMVRAEIEDMKGELLEIRETENWLLVSVDEQEKVQLQRCFADMLERSKRAQFNLRSLSTCIPSPSRQEDGSVQLKRTVRTHQMTLSRNLLAVVGELVEHWEKYASAVKLQQSAAQSLGIISHSPDLSRVLRRRLSAISNSAMLSTSTDMGSLTFDGWREDTTVKKQQAEMYHVYMLVSNLASGHDELLNNIEYNVKISTRAI